MREVIRYEYRTADGKPIYTNGRGYSLTKSRDFDRVASTPAGCGDPERQAARIEAKIGQRVVVVQNGTVQVMDL
jgi:hypothetical protein